MGANLTYGPMFRFSCIVAALLCCQGLTGCSSIETYDSVARQPTTSVDVFREGKPERPHKEIALLADDGGIGEQTAIEKKFVKKAKNLGGNALIMHPPVPSGVEPGAAPLSWKKTYQFRAAVVVYTEGSNK